MKAVIINCLGELVAEKLGAAKSPTARYPAQRMRDRNSHRERQPTTTEDNT